MIAKRSLCKILETVAAQSQQLCLCELEMHEFVKL